MSSRHRIELAGCSPEPLMSYLKALGILRLVAEQADCEALGYWDRDLFVLSTSLDRPELEEFFLQTYQPTPILGPWAGGSGFFGRDNRTAVDTIAASSVDRLRDYRWAIAAVRRMLDEEGLTEKPSGDDKARLLRRYRREMPDQFIHWMDALMALGQDAEWYAPILGTGGNDGRLDFTQNFMRRVIDLGFHREGVEKREASLLRGCLWGTHTSKLGASAVGQFSPGRAGGPNATQGMEAGSIDNPWDYLTSLEGALLLSSAAVRRLETRATGRAAFPFTVTARPVGAVGASEAETQEARGELWLPLWSRPASAVEVRTLFSEGRAEVGRKPVRDAVGFSRAVAGLGTDRGVAYFSRYALFKRSGKSFLAVATERFIVPRAPRESIELLAQIDQWVETLRAGTRGDGSTRLQSAVRRLESAIYTYCKYGRREDLLDVLIACGQVERELAVTGGRRGGNLLASPLRTLRQEWSDAVNDGSPEFEIALALASMGGEIPTGRGILPHSIRTNLEPVKALARGRWAWDEKASTVAWTTGGLTTNLHRILSRRLVADGRKRNLAFRRGVRLSTIARFLAGDLDDQRTAELLWALVLIDMNNPQGNSKPASVEDVSGLPRAYALLKPLFLPWALRFSQEYQRWCYDPNADGDPVKFEPHILPLLSAGRTLEASAAAEHRLRISGVPTLLRAGSLGETVDPERLAAALLLPVRNEDLDRLLALVAKPPDLELHGD